LGWIQASCLHHHQALAGQRVLATGIALIARGHDYLKHLSWERTFSYSSIDQLKFKPNRHTYLTSAKVSCCYKDIIVFQKHVSFMSLKAKDIYSSIKVGSANIDITNIIEFGKRPKKAAK
jgi:hypothetical protein